MNFNEKIHYQHRSISVQSQILLMGAYVLLSYLANLLRHGNKDFLRSLAVSVFVIAFFYLLAYIVRLMFNPAKRKIGFIWGAIIFLLFPAFIYIIVYLLLPSLNYYLYKPHVAFNWSQFFGNTLFAGFSVFMAVGMYTAFYSKGLKQDRIYQLERAEVRRERKIEQMNQEKLFTFMQSHHIKGSLHAIVCRAEEFKDTLIPLLITNLTDILDYSVDLMRGALSQVPIERELAMLNNTIESARLRYGASAFLITSQGNPTGQFIAPLTLLTLVENAFTHGEINEAHPLKIDLVFALGFFSFTVTNKLSSQSPTNKTWGKGMSSVQQSLSLLDGTAYSLSPHEEQGLYTVCLTLTYNL